MTVESMDAPSPQPSVAARIVAWLGLAVLVAVPLALTAGVATAWIDDDDEIATLHERLDRLALRRENPAPLEAEAKSLRTRSPDSLGYLAAPDIDRATATLEQIVAGIFASNQVQMTGLRRLPPTEGIAKTLRLEATGEASSAATFGLLQALEQDKPMLIIDKLTIQRRPDGMVSMRATLRAFWTPPR